jgi:hypothetical protein
MRSLESAAAKAMATSFHIWVTVEQAVAGIEEDSEKISLGQVASDDPWFGASLVARAFM